MLIGNKRKKLLLNIYKHKIKPIYYLIQEKLHFKKERNMKQRITYLLKI